MKNKKLWLIFPAAAVFALAVLLAVGLILRPSPPNGLAVDDLGVLYWEGDDRASSYTVDIDGESYTTDVWYMDIFDITDEYKTYTVTVTAKGFLGFKRAKTISYDLPALPEDAFIFTLKSDESGFNVALNPDVAVSGKVIIPSSHDGKPVTGIASQGFKSRQDLTSVFLPDSVTSISVSAFSGDKSLQRVRFSQSLTSIGNAAFLNCSSLKEVTLPEGLLEIGGDAFKKCASLTHVEIPATVKNLGSGAFSVYNAAFILGKDTTLSPDLFNTNIVGTVYSDATKISDNWNLSNDPLENTPKHPILGFILLNCTFKEDEITPYVTSLTLTEIYPPSEIGGGVIMPPYRKGYNFLGWTEKKGSREVNYLMSDLIRPEKLPTWPQSPTHLCFPNVPYGTTLYPVWEKIKTYDK